LGAGLCCAPGLPAALVLLVIAVAGIWIPVRATRLGLVIYAIGSDRVAAFRSGVSVARARVIAYAIGGLFSAVGGLGLTMTTGIGAPLAGGYYTLRRLPAIVIRGGLPATRARGAHVPP